MAIDYVVIAASAFFCLGFVGNSITVGFIVVSKKLHTPTNVTISCLAASDVLASVTRYVMILPDTLKSFLNENLHQYVYIYVFISSFGIPPCYFTFTCTFCSHYKSPAKFETDLY